MSQDEAKLARIKELQDQAAKLHQELSDLSHDPNHPVFKPETLFSVGEEVKLQRDGSSIEGKVTGIREDGKYDVAILSLVVCSEVELKKIA